MDIVKQIIQFLLTNPLFAWIFLVVWVALLLVLLHSILKKENKSKNNLDFSEAQTQTSGLDETTSTSEKENGYWKINSVGDLLAELIDEIKVVNPDSIRILRIESALGKVNCLGQNGDEAEKYAYLDEQICSLLESENRILNPDIRKIPQVKLHNGYDFPIAIYAFAIKDINRLIGVLWIGFKNSRQLTEHEVRYIQGWVDRISVNFLHWMKWDELNLENRILSGCLNQLNIPMFVLNPDGFVQFCNPPMSNVDITALSWVGRNYSELQIDESIRNLFDPNSEADVSNVEVVGVENRIFHVNKYLISDNDKEQILFIFQERSEQEKKEKIFKENITLLTHDLRSPLSLVRGYATMLSVVGTLNEQQSEYATNIIRNVDGFINMIRNLLGVERLEMGAGLIIENMELISVVKKVVDTLIPYAHQKQIQINQENLQNKPINIQGDVILIEQAIYNVVDNAIKYSSLKGVVDVKILDQTDLVELQICDNGIGIAEVDLPHIFNKFYRIKINQQEKRSESGIGLALAKLIIEKHSGTIDVKSTIGQGSIFIIKLPKQQ